MNITKEQAIALDAEIDAAIAAILDRHGLQRSKRRTTYGDSYRYTIEASPIIKNEAGVNTASPEASAWISVGPLYGFSKPEEALGRTFRANGDDYLLIGMKPRARKYPVIGQSIATGQRFAFPHRVLASMDDYDADSDLYDCNGRKAAAEAAARLRSAVAARTA